MYERSCDLTYWFLTLFNNDGDFKEFMMLLDPEAW